VSIHQKTFTQIKSQKAESYDDFFQFKQETYPFTSGLTLNNVRGLSAINDSTINNYSCLFLTDKLLDSDIYTFNTKQTPIVNIVGTIEFKEGFLYFDDVLQLGEFPDNPYDGVESPSYNSVSIKEFDDILHVNSSHFEIIIIDGIFCKIRHSVDDTIFYLVHQPGIFEESDFYFTTVPQSFCIEEDGVDNSTFYCLYDQDDGVFSLHKAVSGNETIDSFGVSPLQGRLTLTPIPTGGLVNSSTNIAKVTAVKTVEPKINTSWVSYSIDNIEDGEVNDIKSRSNIKDNHLLTFEYSNTQQPQQFRDLKLKNTLTDTNTISRGGVFDTKIPEIPSVNHREYTTISTGNVEETGYPNITLQYQMYTKDIHVEPGEKIAFQTGNSLYPYEKLNINDTSFVVNGSLGGLTPLVSDRITYKEKQTDIYNGGVYLTTWLSAGDINTKGVWVDRYYIPDLVTKQQALSSLPVYNPTFETDINTLLYNNANLKEIVSKNPVFDKKSDIVITPNTWYEYSRIGGKDITSFINSISGLTISNFSSSRTFNGINDFNEIRSSVELDGDIFISIPSSTINEFNSFTLKFDYDIDWVVNDFYQLIGNSYQSGFGIFKNKKITPFVYIVENTPNNNKLKVYNTDMKFLFETTFSLPIETVILSEYLKDITVIDIEGSVYKIATNGTIRQYLKNIVIVSYISWTQDNEYAYFLYSDGSCIKLDLTLLTTEPQEVVPFQINENITSIIKFNGILWGINGECIKYDDTYGLVVVNNIIYRYNFIDNTKELFLEANNSKIICTIDDDGSIYTATNNTITKVTKNRQFINSTSVESLSSTPIRIDTISEFNDKGDYVVDILYVSKSVDGSIITTRYNKELVNSSQVTFNLSSVDPKDYVLTNYKLFDPVKQRDTIRFSIGLVNIYDRKDVVNKFIDIPTQKISKTGTFVLRCDTNQGNFTIFNNYQKLGNIEFNPAEYRLDDLFGDDIFIGTAGESNNTPLMNILKQKNYYTIHNSTVSNLKLYNIPLKDYEIHGLLLEPRKIQYLTLTLPCGQRNNMEEIRRLFFFQPPNSKSTDINVNVKNSTIISQELRDSIKNRILIDIKSYLPGHVNINDITFTTYK